MSATAARARSPSQRARDNERLSRQIARIHAASRMTYGPPRVHAELQAQGGQVSLPLCTTQADREAPVAPDRFRRRFEASRPNRLWVAGITYVPTQEGFLYLATVLDVFRRKVVGWVMGARQTAALVRSALASAHARIIPCNRNRSPQAQFLARQNFRHSQPFPRGASYSSCRRPGADA